MLNITLRTRAQSYKGRSILDEGPKNAQDPATTIKYERGTFMPRKIDLLPFAAMYFVSKQSVNIHWPQYTFCNNFM